MNVLYLSYDGALDPLGQSQVVPLVEKLTMRGHRVDLLSFEKPARWHRRPERDALTMRLASAGIGWRALRYHKRVPLVATVWDLTRGLVVAGWLVRRRGVHVRQARAHPAALIAWLLGRAFGIPFVFDMRALYADQRVDGGLWRAGGFMYRSTKRLESLFLRDAAVVITLTYASVPGVESRATRAARNAAIEVIPTPVDLKRFVLLERPQGPFTLAYVGSLGTVYLLDEMLAFGRTLLDEVRDARLLFLVNDEAEQVRAAARAAGLAAERLDVRTVSHAEVPHALALASATFAFVGPTTSSVAASATKISESLALGLPVAVNAGVGDVAELVQTEGVGVLVDPFMPSAYPDALGRLLALSAEPSIRLRCRDAATRWFDRRTDSSSWKILSTSAMSRSGGSAATAIESFDTSIPTCT